MHLICVHSILHYILRRCSIVDTVFCHLSFSTFVLYPCAHCVDVWHVCVCVRAILRANRSMCVGCVVFFRISNTLGCLDFGTLCPLNTDLHFVSFAYRHTIVSVAFRLLLIPIWHASTPNKHIHNFPSDDIDVGPAVVWCDAALFDTQTHVTRSAVCRTMFALQPLTVARFIQSLVAGATKRQVTIFSIPPHLHIYFRSDGVCWCACEIVFAPWYIDSTVR